MAAGGNQALDFLVRGKQQLAHQRSLSAVSQRMAEGAEPAIQAPSLPNLQSLCQEPGRECGIAASRWKQRSSITAPEQRWRNAAQLRHGGNSEVALQSAGPPQDPMVTSRMGLTRSSGSFWGAEGGSCMERDAARCLVEESLSLGCCARTLVLRFTIGW